MSTRRDDAVQVPAKSDPSLGGPPRGRTTVRTTELQTALSEEVTGETRFDDGSRAMYANDASKFRQVPIGVVVPATLEDVVTAHRICQRFGAPVLNRGAGTSLSGETVNNAVVLDHSKYLTSIGELDLQRKTVTCEPGVINEELNRHTGQHDLVFGPDPSTHSRCVIGGNIGNNSCGVHSVQAHLYGPGPRTSDNVHALEVVTYDGARFWVGVDEEDQLDSIIAAGGRKAEIYSQLRDLRDRYADEIRRGFASVHELPRRVSGYNLDELLPENGFNVARALVGTESTCATALQAQLLLSPALFQRTLVVVEYATIVEAAEHVVEIVDQWRPIALEGLDEELIQDQRQQGMHLAELAELPGQEPGAWLLVQFGADTSADSIARAHEFARWLVDSKDHSEQCVSVVKSAQEGGNSGDIWQIREGGLGSTAFARDEDNWPGWEDSAVPPSQLGPYLEHLQQLMARHQLRGAFYGHFGEGCLHSRISFDLRSREGIADYRAFMQEAADLVVSFGGTLSGEHGDGQQRGELLDKQYGSALVQAMREFKAIWDPEWKMNPGKVIDAYRLDENLRLGIDYNPARPQTRLAYPEEGGDFSHSTLRCVGIGKCRNPEGAPTMCPSYQVTREEKHSTRGRSRMLFEMLQGEVITDGWQSREVADGLELCLACKGCTTDCPVQVDMPTYKAEFRYHHYRSWRRWRPRYAYAFGFVDQAARLAARVPEWANFATQTPVLREVVKFIGGIDPRRPLPQFAPMSLQEWFQQRGGSHHPHGKPVVLFPDTFNNYLHTEVGVACVEAIEQAGWQVVMPNKHLCCGRPLYDYGFLDMAERYLRHVINELREEIRHDTPVVGMEPSCLAVFRDELSRVLPHDDDAHRLRTNAYHFAEFFEQFDVPVPDVSGEGLLWGHCHQRATGGMDADARLLTRMGMSARPVSGGCCGLAGAWGFESGKYQLSMDCGEQAVLPAVREADPSTQVIANGFSCKTQIDDAGTGRHALHVAEVMRSGQDAGSPAAARPAPSRRSRIVRTVAPAVGLAGLAAATSWILRVRRRAGR